MKNKKAFPLKKTGPVFPPIQSENFEGKKMSSEESSSSLEKRESLWATEQHKEEEESILNLNYKIKKTLFSKKSPFQSISIVDSVGYGKMLLNDDIVMISERDERVYHEMIAHVPLFVHPSPESVLIIGGGDGGTAREVLLHSEVKECDMVEIDSLVVKACKKFFPQTSKSLKDPRLKLHIEDGVEYVKNCKKKYDLVIVDSTDPIGPSLPLFNQDFYHGVQALLKKEALVVSQAESPFYAKSLQRKILEFLNSCEFSFVGLYNYSNLTYPGGLWSFSFGSQGILHPLKNFNKKKWKEWKTSFFYYNEAIHKAAFSLPEFMKNAYKDLLS